MTQLKQIDFVGPGMMGAPMVQCLCSAGFELFIADAARAAALAGQTGAQRLNDDNAASLDAFHDAAELGRTLEARGLAYLDAPVSGGVKRAQAVSHPMTFGTACIEVWNEAAPQSTPATGHTEMYRLLPGAAS